MNISIVVFSGGSPHKKSEYPKEFGIKPGRLLLSQESLDKIIYSTYFFKHFTCIPLTSSITLQLEIGKRKHQKNLRTVKLF